MSSVSRRYRPCCTIRRSPSVSVLDREGTHSPGLNPVYRTAPGLLHMYYTRLCSKKLLSDIRERELCLSSLPSRSCRLSSAVTSPVARSPFFSSRSSTTESLCTWLLFLESLAATRNASSELETILSPPFSPFRRLYLVQTSLFLFARCLFKGGKE